jgi:hypothetical protein
MVNGAYLPKYIINKKNYKLINNYKFKVFYVYCDTYN